MKQINRLRLSALAATLTATIAVNAAEPINSDSASTALATFAVKYLQPTLDRQFQSDNAGRKSFSEGVSKAFTISASESAYYQGIVQGLNLRENIARVRAEGYPIDEAVFLSELCKIINGEGAAMSLEQANKQMESIAAKLRQATQSKQAEFLSSKESQPNVKKLPSGLLFETITEGTGASPTMDDTVEVKYTGKLADGTEFDGTKEKSVKLPVKNLIRGFSEGLTLMRTGGTYRLYIPSDLGYGDRGAGDVIPPGAALDFTVTLVDIMK